jgi:hypothetical protein
MCKLLTVEYISLCNRKSYNLLRLQWNTHKGHVFDFTFFCEYVFIIC